MTNNEQRRGQMLDLVLLWQLFCAIAACGNFKAPLSVSLQFLHTSTPFRPNKSFVAIQLANVWSYITISHLFYRGRQSTIEEKFLWKLYVFDYTVKLVLAWVFKTHLFRSVIFNHLFLLPSNSESVLLQDIFMEPVGEGFKFTVDWCVLAHTNPGQSQDLFSATAIIKKYLSWSSTKTHPSATLQPLLHNKILIYLPSRHPHLYSEHQQYLFGYPAVVITTDCINSYPWCKLFNDLNESFLYLN